MAAVVDESYQLGAFRDNEDSLRRLKKQAGVALDLEFDHLRQAGLAPGLRVLDAGCGPGIITTQIAVRMQPERLVALDCNEISLTETRHQLDAAAITSAEVCHGNVYDENFAEAGAFDFAYTRLVFQHLSDPRKAMRNLRATLSSGGRLCVCDIDDRWHGIAPELPELGSFLERARRAQARRGGNRHVGSGLAHLLAEAGFREIRCTMLLMSTSLIESSDFCDLVFGYKLETIDAAELSDARAELQSIRTSLDQPGAWAGIGVFFVSGAR
jgi:ubiquinone/menaquinone biosynthesis C-methylase UbiE